MPPYIEANVARKLTFASHQCGIAVINELVIGNNGDATIHDAALEIEANPAFLKSRVVTVDRLSPNSRISILDRDISLNGQMLLDLTEAISGELTIRLRRDEDTLAERTYPIELLAQNEWGGGDFMPELLAAFVTPNDSAISQNILKPASDILHSAGKSSAMDGYEGRSRSRVWEMASAIWSAVIARNLSYALNPASFETNGQKIRTPSMIMDEGIATCLDSTLLFAAALEQAGLNPVIVLLKGHALVGVWLQPEEFASLIVDDAATIRTRMALNELILFETTFALNRSGVSFSGSIDEARRLMSEEREADFSMLIDVRRARMRRFRPISLKTIAIPAPERKDAGITDALEDAPALPGFDIERQDGVEDTPKTRLDNWQRRLLDLSVRNRLLNFRESKAAVNLYCPNPGKLEDKLAEGLAISFAPLPAKGAAGQDESIHLTRTGEYLPLEYASSALDRNQIMVELAKEELESRLVKLYRKARSELQEGGANTLYLALGFLVWQRRKKDNRKFRAPLILIPVSLTRTSVRAGVKMKLHDDEPRLNSTLLQMLQQDFSLSIPGLREDNLPKDEHGIDVKMIWRRVREAVKGSEGFEVVEDTVLSTFSFAKYLMWKDLTDRVDRLKENPVVKHLIDTPKETYASDIGFPRPENLDKDYSPGDFYTPLPADSSQLACVAAAALGKDFVLVGPPGTGKSQTISNMITHLLGSGKTVLFVSEKMAALDVVYKRIKAHGLGQFCLELHSNKAKKRDVIEQLGQSWDSHVQVSNREWEDCTRKLKIARDDLNAYVRSMHKVHRNGLTVHHALGMVVRDKNRPDVDLSWARADEHSAERLEELGEIARDIDLTTETTAVVADSPLAIIHSGDWSPSWQRQLETESTALANAADALGQSLAKLLNAIRISLPPLSEAKLDALHKLTGIFQEVIDRDLAFSLTGSGRADLKKMEAALDLLSGFRKEEAKLSVPYADRAWDAIDGADIAAQWSAAESAWWPYSLFAKNGIKKYMQSTGASRKPLDTGADASVLSAMREKGRALDRINRELEQVREWHGFDTDPAAAKDALLIGKELRRLVAVIGDNAERTSEITDRLHNALAGAGELFGEEGSIGRASNNFDGALSAFTAQINTFDNLSGSSLSQELSASDAFIGDVLHAARAVTDNQSRLKDWCLWRQARQKAIDAGLYKLVQAVEQGAVAIGSAREVFEINYRRWWLNATVDNDELLKQFSSRQHGDRIKDFRELDDQLAKVTSQYIAAKLSADFHTEHDATEKQEFGILKRELEKKKRHKPVRQLMTDIPNVIVQLKPCLLMSPLSIAQYLPAEHANFDVVIFDEASQITVWDAVGAIARGKRVIVAGDPKQLPPTNFFNRSEDDEDGEVHDIDDMESILDEMLGSSVPSKNLSWHYRSRNESLITFSNHRYYDGKLITFPSPVVRDSAVKLVTVDGHYERGGSRTSKGEARAIVAEIEHRLGGVPKDENAESIGVITFNSEQQQLIEDLLDEARRRDKTLEPHFSEDASEPVFVKNLETVQGDERDVCLFSVTYGPDHTGHMTMNFGPVNRDGGERRLNVAITRSRSELLVFTTMEPDRIDLSRTSARGVADLKHFLEFAKSGASAIPRANFGPQGDFDSPFEQTVAGMLREKGWQIHPQVGVSSYRIDLGIVHPDYPGRYLCGVECDGATYHRSATARDRDKIRESVLNGLGWRLLRIWSTDFWIKRDDSIAALHKNLETLLEQSRAQDQQDKPPAGPARQRQKTSTYPEPTSEQTEAANSQTGSSTLAEQVPENETLPITKAVDPGAGNATPAGFAAYRRADLSTAFRGRIDASLFYEPSYKTLLQGMVQYVLKVEGPILLKDLTDRIARAHGFQRSGDRIRKRIEASFKHREHLVREPDGGKFLWPAETFASREIQPRLHATDADIRLPAQIAIEELVAISKLAGTNSIPRIARLLGIKRIGRDVRKRLEMALSQNKP